MRFEGTVGKTRRPNRYIDWRAQVTGWLAAQVSKPVPDHWASVLVRVSASNAKEFMENLKWLIEQSDPANPDSTIKMMLLQRDRMRLQYSTRDEDATIPLPDDSEREYYAYLQESAIYSDVGYKFNDHYQILSAGPAIEELAFNQPGEGAGAVYNHETASQPVAIGVIDDGIAFAHERFRDGKESRVHGIWLQDIEKGRGNDVTFGTRLLKNGIEHLLDKHGYDETAVYRDVGMLDFGKPGDKTIGLRWSHGTHVMDLAAGADSDDEFKPPIFAVQLPAPVTLDTSGVKLGSYALQGLRYLMDEADDFQENITLVVNFSYGTLAGPKDGFGEIEREIDRLVEQRAAKGGMTYVVLPAGNSFESRANATMTIGTQEFETITWTLPPDDQTPSFLEIWLPEGSCDATCPIAICLKPPGENDYSGFEFKDGQLRQLTKDCELIGGIYYDAEPFPGGNRGRIFIALNPTAEPLEEKFGTELPLAPAGQWTLAVENKSCQELKLQLNIQRDDTPAGFRMKGRQSYFEHPNAHERDPDTGDYNMLAGDSCPINPMGTLSGIGGGTHTFVIGAGEKQKDVICAENEPEGCSAVPAYYTSEGPTDARKGPDFSAITDCSQVVRGVLGAGTLSGTYLRMSGTSVAAPQATRQIALAVVSGRGTQPKLDEARNDIVEALKDGRPASGHPSRLGKFVLEM